MSVQQIWGFIPPILKKIDDTDGVDICDHEDVSCIRIEASDSGDETRPYLAVETSRCKICNGLIIKHWLTAYNYGVKKNE